MKTYYVLLEVISDPSEGSDATAQEVQEGLEMVAEMTDDGEWNKGKFAINTVYSPIECPDEFPGLQDSAYVFPCRVIDTIVDLINEHTPWYAAKGATHDALGTIVVKHPEGSQEAVDKMVGRLILITPSI